MTRSIILIIITILFSCSKNDAVNSSDGDRNPNDNSPAAIIAGTFSGSGQVLPDNISLGNYKGCIEPPGWKNNFITGQAQVTISKSTDSSVSFVMNGGPFKSNHYSDVRVSEKNGKIEFGFGSYDINSKLLYISRNTAPSVFTGSPACLQGMPYYSGWDVLLDGNYVYTTHGRVEFTGSKN